MSIHQQPPKTATERMLPYQWKAQYSTQNQTAGVLSNDSSNSRAVSRGVQGATHQMQQTSFSNTNNALSRKVNLTTTLRQLAEDTLALVLQEIADLQQCMSLTSQTIDSKKSPAVSTSECLRVRSKRPPTESIRDEVEKSLELQAAALAESQRLLTSAFDAQQHELSRLQAALAALEADVSAKTAALDVDMECLSLEPGKSSSPNLSAGGTQPAMGGVKAALDPGQWQGSTEKLCASAKGVQQVSSRLRSKSASLIQESNKRENQVHNQLLSDLANSARHIQEGMNEINTQLAQVCDEISEVAEQRSSCETSLQEKEEPLMIAQNRLKLRQERPNPEMVYDDVQKLLEREVASVKEGIQQLTRELQKNMSTHSKLASMQSNLEWTRQLKDDFLQLELTCQEIQQAWTTFQP